MEQVEERVRQRLRSLRRARGWSLDELSRRTSIGPSTLSRIETGHRRIVLDQLAPIARALQTTVDALLAADDDGDVVIRAEPEVVRGMTVWPLSADDSGVVVAKLRISAARGTPEPKVHPGREWFYVLDGTARLVLGGREILVPRGRAARFSTMTPHWIAGEGGPVDLLVMFDRDGERAHLTG